MMKGFFKFVFFAIVAVVLWNCFSSPDVEIIYSHANHNVFDGFWGGVLAPFITVLLIIGAIFIVFGVAAAVLVAFAIVGFSLLFVGLSMFWPIILAIALFYWLFSDSKQQAS